MGRKRFGSQGFTLIATLLMLLLLSGIAIGLMMMVNTEGKVGGADLQNNMAYHNAEGAIEKMTSDLAATFKSVQAPKPSDICALGTTPYQPVVQGVTWKDYTVQPTSGCSAALPNNYGQIQSGPNQGLWAQIVPVTMLATAAQPGGQEVSMMRTAQVALIPVFQFGVFSDSDLSFFSGPNFDFAGRVHTNGDLYPEVGNGSTLRFHDKVTAFGNVVRAQLANGFTTASNYAGAVKVPTKDQGCDLPAQTGCRDLGLSEGSVTGAGGNPPQSSQNSGWPSLSLSTYNAKIVDGNYGQSGGTGAKSLSMPFVNGTTFPYEIIRRPQPGDSVALGQSREYNMAQIHVLLSDDPDELPGGSGDAENVRLANVPGSNQYGINVQALTPWDFPPFNGTGVVPPPAGASQYYTYFAAASAAVPDNSSCTNGTGACPPTNTNAGATALAFDWPLAPVAPPVGFETMIPAGAPNMSGAQNPAPVVTLCPPAGVNPLPPGVCNPGNANPNPAPPYPYEVITNFDNGAKWNLIDGYLRVEYRDINGNWNGVTREWLSLGFARGPIPPSAAQSNVIHPNAILLLQQPADRNGDGTADPLGQAPVCRSTGGTPVRCTRWDYGRPPEVLKDTAGNSSPYAEITNGGINGGATKFNWYPINFYDTREGEIRDIDGGNNSCTAAGLMNAVEIDMANLKRWLWGQIGVSGLNADALTQNGWVLYYSDRRGMLKNPNSGSVKTGDSGLEDSINAPVAAGTPDGVLDGIPPGKKYSPEDANQNKVLDNFGHKNIGLGFWNGGTNVNGNIVAQKDPYQTTAGNPRITSCAKTGRRNWVSGARHVLRLVNGSLGNVPVRTDNTGGFTVASENPVYILGDYNSNAGDTTWSTGLDMAGHAAASVIADSVTLLSNNWRDLRSTVAGAHVNATGSTTAIGNRTSTTTYYRLAIAGGKNVNFPRPTWNGASQDYGTDGGVHNFLRYIEAWGGTTLNYKGSLVSMYYSTYATGVFKCCTTVYGPPTRNYSFDADFAIYTNMPPGTPLFRDVDTLGYRQLFAVRDK